MAKLRVPFSDTQVSADKSMSEIQVMLRELKFDVVAGVIENRRMVMARHGKVKKQPPDLTAGEFNRREC